MPEYRLTRRGEAVLAAAATLSLLGLAALGALLLAAWWLP